MPTLPGAALRAAPRHGRQPKLARRLNHHAVLGIQLARTLWQDEAGGTLLSGGTGGRRLGPAPGSSRRSPPRSPRSSPSSRLRLAPVRVNLIAPGFVDTPLSASLLADQLEDRRNGASRDSPHPPGRRPRRRRRPRGPPHDQHRAHRRDVRRRRRTAVRFRHDQPPGGHRGQPADRRLCAAVGLPLGGAGQPGRLGGLAVLPALRRAVGVLPPAGPGRWPFPDPARRRVPGQPQISWTRRWCWRPRSPPPAAPPCSPTPSRSAATSAATTSARLPGMLLRQLACTGGEIEAEVSYAPAAGVRPHPPDPDTGPRRARPPGAAPTGCCCPPRSASASTATPRPPGSGWPPGRPPCSRSATGRWPTRRWPPGPRRRSPPGWTTPWRAGGPGRRSTRATRARGRTWCTIPGGCSRR